ncbi:MAG: DUF2142 domain-containing protein, partial [Thermoleophilaceae bacterium]|nr:DUF2142 domain-containing protein [Thermoleophilaceae bacterium]
MHSSDRYFQRVQIGAILAVVIGAVVIATGFMLQRDERLTGNNFVRSAVLLATLDGDHPVLCTDGQHVPAGTGGVRLFVGTWGRPGPRLDATLTSSSGKSLATGSASNYKDGSFAKIPLLGLKGTVDGAKLCLRVTGGRVAFAGEPNGAIDGDSNLTIGTRTLTSDLHVEYVGFGRPTAAAQIPTILARASLFRPGWVGPWTYYLLALLGIALLGLAVTLLVRFAGGGMRRRQWTILIALITFGNCFIWSLVTPAFQVPDEAAHYAYVDTLAQRGMPGKHVGAGAGAYSNSLVLALQITAVNIVQNDQGKPPWFKSQEQAWQKADAALGDTANIGSGWSPAATYSPLYYGPAVVPYKLAGDNTFSRIWLIRLYSALMVAAAAALAFLLALELAPRTAWFAPVAGLAVAFEPMMVHIGAGVQNDSMLILTATAMLYAVVRMLKRGLTIKWA